MTPERIVAVAKPIVFVAALVPLTFLVYRIVNDQLGTNPIETLHRYNGDWTLRFLLITLAVTPLRWLTGWPYWIRFRRMLGLFAFFYATLHFTTWIGVDKLFDWNEMMKDVIKRPFITLGFTCLVLLIPLAITSTNAMVRRL